MSDCPNVEMREALPELLHGRLDVVHAARVREHVAVCAECAAELELLERVRRTYAKAPAIDTAAIVRALPVPHARRSSSLGVLRLAAAIVIILAGALVLRTVVGRNASQPEQMVLLPRDSAVPALPVPNTPNAREPLAAGSLALAMSVSEVDDLDAEELEALLSALDRIDAAPVAEPDTLIGSVPGVGS
jgi:hypothetical protein